MNRLTVTLPATHTLFLVATFVCALILGVADRSVAQDAHVLYLDDGWEFETNLPVNAALISMQGIVNEDAPELYFVYPDSWPFTFTRPVLEYYRDTRDIRFNELTTFEEALDQFADQLSGYVVWDKDVRTSLTVSFTVAALEKAIVVNEDLIPLVEQHGLEAVEDFRGAFTGQSDVEIYSWAYDQYWDRSNKKRIVWMGGASGKRMEPGVADWGIYNEAFFTDLSADPADTLEYQLHRKILAELDEDAIIFGWHSYAKDTEGQHVTLISEHALRMEGLNTLPNASFSHQIPTTVDFEFKNNHNVEPGEEIAPEPKVYIACIQTDGIGIGAWLKPGRGSIPYAWEVTMNWVWLFPGQMQFFYDMATPNDYFIGALSGPGYMYPKPIPRDRHPALITEAEGLMKKLDLRVFEIMDYSEGNRYVGNIDLTAEVVDAYFDGLPDAIGFVNGYGPAHTYEVRDGRALMSYDYYLSPTRPHDDAVADLKELIALNDQRPYYLLLHIRESSDIERVRNILDELGPETEVVPLDVFLTMAGQHPNFTPRFLEP